MELKNHKSALAALATLGITAVAAGATAFVKIRGKRRERRQQEEKGESENQLSPEQLMVYNEAVSVFKSLNYRIYDLRRQRKDIQPLVARLAGGSEKPQLETDNEDLQLLADDIERFITSQVPFINACLACINQDGMTYVDCVRGPVGGVFDDKLDEEPTGADIKNGTPIAYVLRLGYYFPDSTHNTQPVKAIVLE